MKSSFLLLVILSFLFNFTSVVRAEGPILTKYSTQLVDEGCLSEDLINEIKSDFEFTFDDELKDFKLEVCDVKHITNRILRGLVLLKYGQFSKSTKSKDQVFSDSFSDIHPYEFLKNRIKKIHFVKECTKGVGAYVRSKENKFSVCVNSYEKYFSEAWFAATYASMAIHESRHADKDDLGHYTCEHGSQKGASGGCDESVEQKGAYFYGTEYSAYVSKFGKNFHPAMRAESRSQAITYIINKFNKVPKVDSANYVVTRNSIGKLGMITADYKYKEINQVLSGKIFPRIDGNIMIFDQQKKEFRGWSIYDGFVKPDGSYAIDYNLNIENRSDVTDYISDSSWGTNVGAMIFENSLRYYFGTLKIEGTVNLPFSVSNARILKPVLCRGPEDSLYVLKDHETVYEGSLDENKKIQFKKAENCQTNILNVTDLSGRIVALSEDGVIGEFKNKTFEPIKSLANEKFDFLGEAFNLLDFFNKYR